MGQRSIKHGNLCIKCHYTTQSLGDRPPTQGTEGTSPEELPTALELALAKLSSYDDSGWYRNDDQFRISSRVAEHQDPVIKSWTELAMEYHHHRAVYADLNQAGWDSHNA